MGKNIGDDYRSNSSRLSKVELDRSLSLHDYSEPNVLEKDLNRNCLSNMDQRSLILAKRTKSSLTNYDKFRNDSFCINSEPEIRALKINRYNASTLDSTELKNDFRFNNVKSFMGKKNDNFFLDNLDYYNNKFITLTKFPNLINFKP